MIRSLKDTKLAALLGKKGAYITLAGVLAASVAAGAVAYGKALTTLDEPSPYENIAPVNDAARAADKKQAGVPRDTADSSSAAPMTTMPRTAAPETKVPDTQPNVMPVNGEVIAPFSGGELVKSETTGVWKTHDGVDIKADKGTAVKAMNKGVVTKVWEDTLWGYCVIIDHGNGIVGHYYSLTSAVAVAEGDEVNSGDIIGYVGDSAVVENTEGAHLHFGLKQNGEWIDPISYINPLGIK